MSRAFIPLLLALQFSYLFDGLNYLGGVLNEVQDPALIKFQIKSHFPG